MNTKGWIVLAFLVIALVCFVIVGFAITSWNGHDLIAIGWASVIGALMVHIFMSGSELK